MKFWNVLLLILLLCCALTMPLYAADDNFGEEDDFGNVDSVQTEATEATTSAATESPESDAQTEPEQQTTRAPQAVRPPAEQPKWSLPIPVIWGMIAGFGVFGLAAAIFLFVKFAKGK